MERKLLVALAFFLVSGGAIAQSAADKPDSPGGTSQAGPAPAIEDELAAASETSGVLFLANPGKAEQFKFRNNQLICVNCLGGSADTVGFRTNFTPTQTRTHCISTKSC